MRTCEFCFVEERRLQFRNGEETQLRTVRYKNSTVLACPHCADIYARPAGKKKEIKKKDYYRTQYLEQIAKILKKLIEKD